jgi:hypothetical protein
MRRNSQDDEIRDLERRIGSGVYDAADPMRLHALVMRSKGEPLPRHVEIALDSVMWTWDDVIKQANEAYDDRFTGRTPRNVADTVLGIVAEDLAGFLVQILSLPEDEGSPPTRDRFAQRLTTAIERDLTSVYGTRLADEVRRHAEGLGGLSLQDLARHVIFRYRAHQYEGVPVLLRELALEAAEEIATTRAAREELADRIVTAVDALLDEAPEAPEDLG